MVTLRPSAERGVTRIDWLDSRHSFSFGDYYDPRHSHFGSLRVINDDRIAPSGGFGAHPHRDMEIITYVVSGALEHRDSLGNGSVIRPGDVQRMSAGVGIVHSEFNPSPTEPVHLLQIWITPERRGLEPSYEEKHFPEAERRGKLRRIAGRPGEDGAVRIHQDADLYAALLSAGDRVVHRLAVGRQAWVQVVGGGLTLDGLGMKEGDGAAVVGVDAFRLECEGTAEVLVFDLG
jgi:redox-sensitive bicupin YhaK (pirin superfamily)